MKISIASPVALIIGFALIGCMVGGPAYPEQDGRKYLEGRGYSDAFVSRVINGEQLKSSEVLELARSRSSDVRFLVARNPNLTQRKIDIFIKDGDDFVRSGAARNTNLSSEQIEVLTNDPSHTVYATLAQNTALSNEALLRIHEKREPGLIWFAMNPNCPASIRKEIARSNNKSAKHWLEITQERKNSGVYQRGENERWHRTQGFQ